MKITIDRFEGSYAVCEADGNKMISIERSLLPEEAREGDVLTLIDGKYIIDTAETAKRKAYIKSLMDEIFE
ncbi:MAG TPA: DUF3006 domain-containing protein [Thermoclostridium sp.]|mgnify:CR=1 FL=1|nr:DUF3006 domain-containing protein [Clostridiaceae bacterium]HOQ75982.1 DUF3006 domain-containing protein [Thermoclostridium sp.]